MDCIRLVRDPKKIGVAPAPHSRPSGHGQADTGYINIIMQSR